VRGTDITGDHNPIHVDAEFAATTQFGQRIAHGALSASFISAVLGNDLPARENEMPLRSQWPENLPWRCRRLCSETSDRISFSIYENIAAWRGTAL